MIVDTRKSPYAKVWSLPTEAVRWRGGFWLDRFNTSADETIPHILGVFADNESFFHQVENFRIAAGRSDGEFRGTPYGDGDFYKLMEGMIYSYALRGDEKTDRLLDEYIELIAAAQQPDGYISTKQIIGERLSNGTVRHGDVNDFEEYNFGHLFTAASVHKRVTGKDNFLDIARRCAAYLDHMYRGILEEGKAQTAVCPSHYMGLFELYRVTGDEKFREMGRTAIALRDLVQNGTDDNQDRIPLREHRKIVGHAVRSTYLYAGVTDLFLETGDETLPPVLDSCWKNLTDAKIYVNGGCGALYTGTSPFGMLLDAQYVHQAFGYEYQLPNVTAYNETCGALGNIFWTHRMFLREPKAKYMDLIERTYYNLVLAAVSLDGRKYFYENMLRRTKTLDYPVMWPVERSDSFQCFCCPTNVSRSIPQAIDYLYKVDENSVLCGMYGASEAKFQLDNGAAFTLEQATDYPWDGAIRITVKDAETAVPFTLKVRVPGWVESGVVAYGGEERVLSAADADTFVNVAVSPDKGAVVDIRLDMAARYIEAHPKVEEDTMQVCVTRGPLLYCVESPDVREDSLDGVMLLSDARFTEERYEVAGVSVVALRCDAAVTVRSAQSDPNALYQPLRVTGLKKTSLRMIPYFAWDNRGFGEMKIWLPIHYTYGIRQEARTMSTVISHVSTLNKSRVLAKVPAGAFQPTDAKPDDNTIVLNPAQKGQPILGFGANWTDTDVFNLLRMDETEQDRVLELLFDPDTGAGWNFMRVPFASTDWERNFDFYTYDDMPEGEEDWGLSHFSVQKDIDRGFFALLRRVKERYPNVELLATVWGLPGWMKSNDSIVGGIFRPECTEVYARYLRMAVQAFQEQGLDLYAITTQNEPMSSDFPNNNRGTPCTRFTWRLQRPVLLALRREFDAHHISTRIWAYDHNYDMVETFVDPLMADGEVRQAIDGLAFHPYRGNPAVLTRYEEKYPDMPLYSTEKSVYDPAGMDELLRQLRHGVRCYILWSFFEDSYGGPHQLAGTAFKYDSPRRGKPNAGLINNDPLDGNDWQTGGSYGLFAQFSKFLRRDMVRIGCTYGHKRWITATAFQDGEGQIAVVTVNQTGADQSFVLRCGAKALHCTVPAMSVATHEFLPDADMLGAAPAQPPKKQFMEAPVWDLAVEELSFEGEAKDGEELRFTVLVKNAGDAPTQPNTTATIDVLLDGDLRIGHIYATIPVLQPGETLTLRTNAPVYDVSGTGCKRSWTATGGWHTLMALMYVGNCYPPEGNEYNNRCCREFFIEGQRTYSLTLLVTGGFAAGGEHSGMNVTQNDLARVYHAMKTPKKLGLILRDENAGIDCCTVFHACDQWRMLYARHNAADSDEHKGYETWMAHSDDLIRWEPMGPVLPQTRSGWDALQADGGIALLDPAWEGSFAPETYSGKYWMSYFGNDLPGYEPDPLRIGMAFTESLETAHPWRRHPEPVLARDDRDARAFERKTLYKSFVIRDRAKSLGAEFVMYYNAKGLSHSIEKIGMAVSSDMLHWRRYGDRFVVESGRPDTAWHIAGDPQIIRFEDLWVMHFFVAFALPGGPTAYDTFAVSRDLVHWTRWEGEPLVAPSTPEDETFAHKPFLVHWKGKVYHFYCAVGRKGRGLALAVSE